MSWNYREVGQRKWSYINFKWRFRYHRRCHCLNFFITLLRTKRCLRCLRWGESWDLNGQPKTFMDMCINFKDGAYFCYCAYVLRICRYSGFLWVVPTNTGMFLLGLKLCGESRTQQVLLVSKMKIGGGEGVTMHFSEIIKLQFRKQRRPYFTAF